MDLYETTATETSSCCCDGSTFDESYTEPAYTEPAYTEPAYTEPVYTEPVYTEPAYTEPAYTEPAYTEPAASAVGEAAWSGDAAWDDVAPEPFVDVLPAPQPTTPYDSMYPSSAVIGGSSGPDFWIEDGSGNVVNEVPLGPGVVGGHSDPGFWIEDANGNVVTGAPGISSLTLGPVGGTQYAYSNVPGMTEIHEAVLGTNNPMILTSRSDVEASLGRPVSLSEFGAMNTGGSDSTGIPSVADPFFGLLGNRGIGLGFA